MKRTLDKDGLITEISSHRYGQKPLNNPRREKFLLWTMWLWLLIPIMGIVPFVITSDELTNDYGYPDWTS